MNTAKDVTRSAMRPLTAKQQRFVCALLEGQGKSAAYRIAYGSCADSHDVSTRAGRLAKSRGVQAALARADKGDFSGLIICRVECEILALRKIANDSSAPSYVRLGALQAILEHRRANPEPEPPRKPETIEEIERILQAQCGQQRDAAHRRNGFDELDEI